MQVSFLFFNYIKLYAYYFQHILNTLKVFCTKIIKIVLFLIVFVLKFQLYEFFLPTEDVCLIRRCITSGFFANAAYLHYTGVYRTVRDDHELHIHPTSVLTFTDPPKWYSLCFICMLIS